MPCHASVTGLACAALPSCLPAPAQTGWQSVALQHPHDTNSKRKDRQTAELWAISHSAHLTPLPTLVHHLVKSVGFRVIGYGTVGVGLGVHGLPDSLNKTVHWHGCELSP